MKKGSGEMDFKRYSTKLKKEIFRKDRELDKMPEGTDEVVAICDIIISNDFKRTKPRIEKIQRAVKHYLKLGSFDVPITVIAITNEQGLHTKFLLVDGYSRYIAAKDWIGLKYIPVKYISIEEYINMQHIKH